MIFIRLFALLFFFAGFGLGRCSALETNAHGATMHDRPLLPGGPEPDTKITMPVDGFVLKLIGGKAMIEDVAAPKPVTRFATELAAASAIFQTAADRLPYYEVGGVITQMPDGSYAVGAPHTDFSGDSVMVDDDPMNYVGKIVAVWHTHACLNVSHIPAWFSQADLLQQRILKVDAFMADLCTGSIHFFDAVHDTISEGEAAEGKLAKVVGHINVTGVSLDGKLAAPQ